MLLQNFLARLIKIRFSCYLVHGGNRRPNHLRGWQNGRYFWDETHTAATPPPAHDLASFEELVTEAPILILAPPKFQLGIRNALAARQLVAAGIDVVQDRCITDHRRFRLGAVTPR